MTTPDELQRWFERMRGELDQAIRDEVVFRERLDEATARKHQLTGGLQVLQTLMAGPAKAEAE